MKTIAILSMSWVRRHQLRLYIRNALWILPALSVPLALLVVALLVKYERSIGSQLDVSPETGRVVMSTVAGSMFTLMVLVCSAVLVTVQLASAQLTPRVIILVYRNPYRKLALALFVFTFTFSIAVLVRIEDTVPRWSTYLAAYGFLFNLVLFVLFIDSMGKTLRPSSTLCLVALLGRDVIRRVFPFALGPDSPVSSNIKPTNGEQTRVVMSTVDGAVLAFDRKGLVALAEQSNCVIELVPEVGQFIAADDPLFRIYHDQGKITDSQLRNSVAVDAERTLEQDPLFAFRIIVDIANKALSPAINDPTTAVLAIDQIHHLLRDVGKRYLAEGREPDSSGQLRLMYRTPNWEDFVLLGTTEIRQYGRDSIQVQRRLRAMLKDLIENLPERRSPVLHSEMALLANMAKRAFPDLADQTLAEAGDLQGIGGSYDEVSEPVHSANAAAAI